MENIRSRPGSLLGKSQAAFPKRKLNQVDISYLYFLLFCDKIHGKTSKKEQMLHLHLSHSESDGIQSLFQFYFLKASLRVGFKVKNDGIFPLL